MCVRTPKRGYARHEKDVSLRLQRIGREVEAGRNVLLFIATFFDAR